MAEKRKERSPDDDDAESKRSRRSPSSDSSPNPNPNITISSAPRNPNPSPSFDRCHCCNVKISDLRTLESQWRIALLCNDCLHKILGCSVCVYCFRPITDDHRRDGLFLSCTRCFRCIHHSCVPLHRYYVSASQVNPDTFLCADCCPAPGAPSSATEEPRWVSEEGKWVPRGDVYLGDPGEESTKVVVFDSGTSSVKESGKGPVFGLGKEKGKAPANYSNASGKTSGEEKGKAPADGLGKEKGKAPADALGKEKGKGLADDSNDSGWVYCEKLKKTSLVDSSASSEEPGRTAVVGSGTRGKESEKALVASSASRSELGIKRFSVEPSSSNDQQQVLSHVPSDGWKWVECAQYDMVGAYYPKRTRYYRCSQMNHRCRASKQVEQGTNPAITIFTYIYEHYHLYSLDLEPPLDITKQRCNVVADPTDNWTWAIVKEEDTRTYFECNICETCNAKKCIEFVRRAEPRVTVVIYENQHCHEWS